MGTTGLTAQAIGQNNRLEVNAVVLRALSLALIIAAFVLLLQNWIEQFGFGSLKVIHRLRASPGSILLSEYGVRRQP